jgi:hypothetical protein
MRLEGLGQLKNPVISSGFYIVYGTAVDHKELHRVSELTRIHLTHAAQY